MTSQTATKSSSEDAPYGLAHLEGLPRIIFLASLAVGLLLLWAMTIAQGPWRGAALIGAILFLDFAQEGLRSSFWSRIKSSSLHRILRFWPLLAGAFLGLLAVMPLWRDLQLEWDKTALLEQATHEAAIEIPDTAKRRGNRLVVAPLDGGIGQSVFSADAGRFERGMTVFSGAQLLPSSRIARESGAWLLTRIPGNILFNTPLEFYAGTFQGRPEDDPELGWNLDGAYRQAVHDLRWEVKEETEKNPAAFGRYYLHLEVDPDPDLATTFVWATLPISLPRLITADSHLVYAVRQSALSNLECGVQLSTSRGATWQAPWADLLSDPKRPRAPEQWSLRSTDLSSFDGAAPQSLAIAIRYPEERQGIGPPTPVKIDFDAIYLADGGLLRGNLTKLRPRQ